ncbi:hypothetical protein [Streptomyces sp. NRRL S-350]|uniref:hypothetical protein n=1 Tax=Streptomyces sp. NRRL S-350 TaxID=1463902 RepID=UPI0004C08B84|nr:hypothetical protein [Streptomyces sp. NRRL S-350]
MSFELSEGVPACSALVRTAAPDPDGDGLVPILAMVVEPEVSGVAVGVFAARHAFAPNGTVARAADSRVRWRVERDGRVVFSLLAADKRFSRIVMHPGPGLDVWIALARARGGTVALALIPGLHSHALPDIARALGSADPSAYWQVSAGLLQS